MKVTGKIIRATIVFLIFAVMGVLFFRIWLGSYYPADVSGLIPTAGLKQYYKDNGGLEAFTQKLRAPYDDGRDGNFFAERLIVVPEAGALQITVRYNDSTLERLADKIAAQPPREDGRVFSYRIFCCRGEAEGGGLAGDTLTVSEIYDRTFMMYNYERLCFEGIDFEGVNWIRLEVFCDESAEPVARIPIYENTEVYNELKPYKVKGADFS